jgi:hypothetical protein
MMLALVGYLLSKTLKQALNVASSLREDPVWLTTALWDVAGHKELPPSVVLNKQSMTPSTSEMRLPEKLGEPPPRYRAVL